MREVKVCLRSWNLTPARPARFAISEHNKMEGDYAPEKHAIIQETIIRFVIGKGYERNTQ